MKAFFAGLGADLYARVWLSIESTVVGALTIAGGIFLDDVLKYVSASPAPWAKYAVIGVGLVATLYKQAAGKAYTAAKVTLLALVVAGSLLPGVARASGSFIYCLAGCEQKAAKVKASALSVATDAGDVQLGPSLWLGPSVSLTPMVFDVANQKWEQNWIPEVAFGLKWRPAAWTLSNSAGALDLAFRAKFSGFSNIDVVPSVTVGDLLKIGYGPRFHFPSEENGVSQRFAVSQLITFGLQRSFGGP